MRETIVIEILIVKCLEKMKNGQWLRGKDKDKYDKDEKTLSFLPNKVHCSGITSCKD